MDDTYLPLENATATGASAVSWAAILAGAAAAVAASLTLFALAAGLNLVSPGSLAGTAAASTVLLAALALIATQWISAALGGYLSGRLRIRWADTPTREVFFRDSAHGFITWCVATVFMASGLVAAASAVVGTRSHAGGVAAYGPANSLATTDLVTSAPSTFARVPAAFGESVLSDGPGSAASVQARRAALAGLSTEFREQFREVRASAAAAHDEQKVAEQKVAAASSMLTALSMLIGAFLASVSAALGGRQRDRSAKH